MINTLYSSASDMEAAIIAEELAVAPPKKVAMANSKMLLDRLKDKFGILAGRPVSTARFLGAGTRTYAV